MIFLLEYLKSISMKGSVLMKTVVNIFTECNSE